MARKIHRSWAAGLWALAIVAPASAQNEQFIPVLVYRTGAYAVSGVPYANGEVDYYRLINERDGGISGVKIVFEECETGYATDRGLECYERLKGKGPTGAAFVVPRSTGVTAVLTEKANTDAEAAAESLNIAVLRFPVVSAADFESAFKMMNEEKCDALYIFASAFAQGHWKRLAQLALDYRLPAMYAFREFVDRGGLLSYGASNSDAYRRAAALVDKILKGLRPSDLPVEQATRFELIINARTAKALGVTIPDIVLVQAHQVIE